MLTSDSSGLHRWVPTGLPPSASQNPALRLACSQGRKYQLIFKLTHIIVIRGGKSQTRVPFVLSLPYSISICPFQWRGSGYTTPICGSIAYQVGRIRQRACARRIFWSSSEAGHITHPPVRGHPLCPEESTVLVPESPEESERTGLTVSSSSLQLAQTLFGPVTFFTTFHQSKY